MADKHNFKIDKGSTFRSDITYTDDSGVVIDLTGYTARMQLRKHFKSSLIHELTTENGGITITPLTGNIDLLITATDTDGFANGVVKYDLEIITGTEVTRVIEGEISISENVTV